VFVIIILGLLLRLFAAPVEIISCDCVDFFGDAKLDCEFIYELPAERIGSNIFKNL